jgi:N6-L-threonylcarbamoyladenine synthase
MRILSIETSCDETAVSIIEASGKPEAPTFGVLSNIVLSQTAVHEKYGGVFPNLAKREHSKNLGPIIRQALAEAHVAETETSVAGDAGEAGNIKEEVLTRLKADLAREPELFESLVEVFRNTTRPDIDLIAVTYGPGLEPALWVGINAAKALGRVWNIPVLPVNHMEGHISSIFLDSAAAVKFPAIALLVSGGHTELVLVSDWLTYTIVGETRDDAVGEAFDKVARMLGLPYPGGPKISQLAAEARAVALGEHGENNTKTTNPPNPFTFPRPMIASHDLDFSFSGLKTSVLYAIEKHLAQSEQGTVLDDVAKKQVAVAFEDAVVETLVEKTRKALEQYSAETLIVAGGVIANKTLRHAFQKLIAEFPGKALLVPEHSLSTDNALMIALAAYVRFCKRPEEVKIGESLDGVEARGNARLT